MLLRIIIIIALLVGYIAPASRAQVSPTVIINELMWMGSSSSSADEWLELRNLTTDPIDLAGWRLTKLSGGAEVTMPTIPAGQSIAASGYFLISNYAETAATSSLAVTPNFVETDVALNNSALQIKLYDASNALIDVADDGAGNPLSGKYVSADKVYASMERNPMPGDGTLAESWHIASRSVGFKPGKTELGTPGSVNSNGLPTANAGPDQTATVGAEINFDGSDSSDPENSPLMYSWDFGDNSTGSEATPKHVYAAAGEFTVTLSVSDGTDSATDMAKVKVGAAPPAALPTTIPPTVTTSPIAPTTNVPPATSCRGVTISEIFPNPSGVDDGEFIEFYNPTATEIPLNGCTIWLNEKRKAVVKELIVPVKKYIVLEKTVSKLSFTNTGGTVKLVDTDGVELTNMTYPKAPDGESWSLVGKEWTWTNQVTPNAKNKAPTDDDAPASTAKKEEKEITQTVGLADVQTMETGVLVRIRGVATVAPDLLGARTIFLQSKTGAVSAVLREGSLKVVMGDEVELTGEVRLSQGRKRISVKPDGLRVLAQGRAIEPRSVTLDQLSPELADVLVSVNGLISASSGAKFVIDDGTAEGDVYIKSSTGIIKPRSVSGDRLFATGIVSVTTAGIKILPRTIDDLRVERVLGATTSVPAKTTALPTAPPHQNLWYWGLVGLGLVAAGVKPGWEALKKRRKAG